MTACFRRHLLFDGSAQDPRIFTLVRLHLSMVSHKNRGLHRARPAGGLHLARRGWESGANRQDEPTECSKRGLSQVGLTACSLDGSQYAVRSRAKED